MERNIKESRREVRERKSISGPAFGATFISLVFLISLAAKMGAAIETGSAQSLAEEVFKDELSFQRFSGQASKILNSLRKKEEQLSKRERMVAEREVEMKLLHESILKKMEELSSAESRLRSTIGEANNAAKVDVEKVVSIYEKMKPKASAAVFELMDPILAAGLLSRMIPERASDILSYVTPERSYTISAFLAGRNVH